MTQCLQLRQARMQLVTLGDVRELYWQSSLRICPTILVTIELCKVIRCQPSCGYHHLWLAHHKLSLGGRLVNILLVLTFMSYALGIIWGRPDRVVSMQCHSLNQAAN